MAEFLNTWGIAGRIVRIINDAEKRLRIISPYLSVHDQIRRDIEHKAEDGSVGVHVIYRHKKQSRDIQDWLESMTSVKTSFCEDLHAKCYLNEKEALLTSMNLYEYSQSNNYEMGVLASREKDPELYEQIVSESERIIRASTLVHEPISHTKAAYTRRKRSSTKQVRQPRRAKLDAPEAGFCIRCKTHIALNPVKPYCRRHFRGWNRYKATRHCHICGKDHRETLNKPACLDCYNKYKSVVEFAS